jgi:hypothetical protein
MIYICVVEVKRHAWLFIYATCAVCDIVYSSFDSCRLTQDIWPVDLKTENGKFLLRKYRISLSQRRINNSHITEGFYS